MTLSDRRAAFPLAVQAEWFWWCQHAAAHGNEFTKPMALKALRDMAHHHDDGRLRTRAASIVITRGWDA